MYFRLQGKRQSCVIGSARSTPLFPPSAKIRSRCDYHNRTNLTRRLIKIKQGRRLVFSFKCCSFALDVWMRLAAEVIHEKSALPSHLTRETASARKALRARAPATHTANTQRWRRTNTSAGKQGKTQKRRICQSAGDKGSAE